MAARWHGLLLVAVLLMLSGCITMGPCTVEYPRYWPVRNDTSGILISQIYKAEAVDDEGRTWLWPGNCTNFLYRLDSNGQDISRYDIDYSIVDISAGAGALWAIPSGRAFSGAVEIYRINLETVTVNSRILLPVKMDWSDVIAGHDFIWVYGRLRKNFFDLSYQLVVVQIDPKSVSVTATYEIPDIIQTKSGAKINPVTQPKLLLIDETSHFLLALYDKETTPQEPKIVKLDLETREYSELAESEPIPDLCADYRKVGVFSSGKLVRCKK